MDTPEQQQVLERNTHLRRVSTLEDGDLLIIDLGIADRSVFPNGHFGPYVLTKEGYVQDVNFHYQMHHLIGI
jgi:hypothetical protein